MNVMDNRSIFRKIIDFFLPGFDDAADYHQMMNKDEDEKSSLLKRNKIVFSSYNKIYKRLFEECAQENFDFDEELMEE